MTDTLGVEWVEYGIRLNRVAPGLKQKPGVSETLGIAASDMPSRNEVDRGIGHTENVSDVVQFLTGPAGAFVTGETYTVKGIPHASTVISTGLRLE